MNDPVKLCRICKIKEGPDMFDNLCTKCSIDLRIAKNAAEAKEAIDTKQRLFDERMKKEATEREIRFEEIRKEQEKSAKANASKYKEIEALLFPNSRSTIKLPKNTIPKIKGKKKPEPKPKVIKEPVIKPVKEPRILYIDIKSSDYSNNEEYMAAYFKLYAVKRRKDDNLYRIIHSLRTRVASAIKGSGFTKDKTTLALVSCEVKTLISHIESQFQSGMTWENYGIKGWHIDHIVPVSSATSKEELEKLFHYTNMQPLWAEVNMSKGDKMADGSRGRNLKKIKEIS